VPALKCAPGSDDMANAPALAIDGAEPIRSRPFPAWPVFDASDEAAVLDALRSGRWGSRLGEGYGRAFTERLGSMHRCRRAIATANGTVALEVALKAVGVQPLDEVIVPAYTFLATATAVTTLGAIPVFADIDPATYTLDPASVATRVSSHTRAIVPVHIAGQPADMDGILGVATTHGLRVVEDAAQAIGAAWRGRGVGAIGDAGTFSFQSSKNLNAGEGGAIVTDDDTIADRAWSLANCGRSPGGTWYQHEVAGSNHRLTEVQAALLVAQIARLPDQMMRRERSARLLESGLRDIPGLSTQSRPEGVTTHARHLFVIRYDASAFGDRPRSWFIRAMRAEGIPCSPGYEIPLHRMPGVLAARRTWSEIARATGRAIDIPTDPDAEDLPNTDRASREEGVWLGQSLLLGSDADMADVITAARRIREWCDSSS
jgi:dTDP-4-amino-4,6-dideoxygalactose transaminase